MQRIIIHWTAGGNRASSTDLEHYHRLVEYDGTVVKGTEAIADNIVTSDGDYAAHTLNLNTGSIGVAMCGMRGAVESPFSAGPSPLTEKQLRACARLVGDLCRQYSIPITPQTVLTHAEVQPTLGVRQRGKWDITRLPFKPELRGAIPVGNYIRSLVAEMSDLATDETAMPTIRRGNAAPRAPVMIAQQDLAHLGYHVGRIDGLFGNATHRAVVSFQSDNGLIPDGVIGPMTWAAFEQAKALPERNVTEESLREAGSQTIKDADRGENAAKTGSALVLGGAGLDTALEAVDKLSGAETALQAAQQVITDNWIILLVGAVGGVGYFYGPRIMASIRGRRVKDAQSGAHMGR